MSALWLLPFVGYIAGFIKVTIHLYADSAKNISRPSDDAMDYATRLYMALIGGLLWPILVLLLACGEALRRHAVKGDER